MAQLTLDSRFCAEADGKITALNQLAEISRIVRQYLPINLPRIIDTRPVFRTAPFDECLPSITVSLDRAVVATHEHIFQRLRPSVA